MGRYAQRRRAGGGPPAPLSLIQMISGVQDGSEALVTYTRPITAGEFELTDFLFSDGAQNPISITQAGPSALVLQALTTVDEGTLDYSGDVPGVLSPDSVELSIL